MTKQEKECRDMADVCELAHKRTVRDIRKKNKVFGLHIKVDCQGVNDCGDSGQAHRGDEDFDGVMTHYGEKAQEIFNDHYDYITNVTKL